VFSLKAWRVLFMKFKLSRINRGLIVLIAAVLCVSVYLVLESVDASKKQSELKAMLPDLLSASSDWLTLGERSEITSNGTYENFLDKINYSEKRPAASESLGKMKDYLYESEALYTEFDDKRYTILLDIYNFNNLFVRKVISRTPSKTKINYYNNTATVSMEVRNDLELLDGKEESLTTSDSIDLQYIDGKWVVVGYQINVW